MFRSPQFIVGSAIATALASLFHLLLGRGWRDLLLYWFIALVGFAVGQGMANILGLSLYMLGRVHVIEAAISCWLAMLVARWLKV